MVNGISSISGCECDSCAKSKRDENDAAIARVKGAFIHNYTMGANEKDAFFNSLKAIDKNYNAKTDGTIYKSVGMATCRAPKGETVKKWLEIINLAVPILVNALKVVEDIIDTFGKKTDDANKPSDEGQDKVPETSTEE